MHRSLKWSLTLRFPYHKPVCSSLDPLCAMCSTNLIPLRLLIIIFGKDWKLWSPSLCTFLQLPVLRLGLKYLPLLPVFKLPLVYVLPVIWETKFYTNIKWDLIFMPLGNFIVLLSCWLWHFLYFTCIMYTFDPIEGISTLTKVLCTGWLGLRTSRIPSAMPAVA